MYDDASTTPRTPSTKGIGGLAARPPDLDFSREAKKSSPAAPRIVSTPALPNTRCGGRLSENLADPVRIPLRLSAAHATGLSLFAVIEAESVPRGSSAPRSSRSGRHRQRARSPPPTARRQGSLWFLPYAGSAFVWVRAPVQAALLVFALLALAV